MPFGRSDPRFLIEVNRARAFRPPPLIAGTLVSVVVFAGVLLVATWLDARKHQPTPRPVELQMVAPLAIERARRD